jgi:hypothetical protein
MGERRKSREGRGEREAGGWGAKREMETDTKTGTERDSERGELGDKRTRQRRVSLHSHQRYKYTYI